MTIKLNIHEQLRSTDSAVTLPDSIDWDDCTTQTWANYPDGTVKRYVTLGEFCKAHALVDLKIQVTRDGVPHLVQILGGLPPKQD